MSQPPSFPLVPDYLTSVPTRMGTQIGVVDGRLVATLRSAPVIEVAGALRASALVCLVDMIAGLEIDDDPNCWVFTSDLSVRLPAVPAPGVVTAGATVLRAGKRSSTIEVAINTEDGAPFAVGLASFSRVPVREGDPVKPMVDHEMIAAGWSKLPLLERPVRDAAGVTVVDAAAGVVQMEITRHVVNPAGAMHGAMVALLAESAAEELVASAASAGDPASVVTDLDVRYLRQGRVSPISTRARFVGPPSSGSVFVELLDGSGTVTAVVTARTQAAPTP